MSFKSFLEQALLAQDLWYSFGDTISHVEAITLDKIYGFDSFDAPVFVMFLCSQGFSHIIGPDRTFLTRREARDKIGDWIKEGKQICFDEPIIRQSASTRVEFLKTIEEVIARRGPSDFIFSYTVNRDSILLNGVLYVI